MTAVSQQAKDSDAGPSVNEPVEGGLPSEDNAAQAASGGVSEAQRRQRPMWATAVPTWFAAMAAQLLLIFVGGPVGLADNGDSTRTLCSVGFYMEQPADGSQRLNDWVISNAYQVDENTCGNDLPTSWWHRIFGLADTLTGASETSPLRIGAVGLINMMLVSTAMASIGAAFDTSRRWSLALAAGLCMFILDIAFLAYARSWYTEPAGFVSMLFGVAAILMLTRPAGGAVPWGGVAASVVATLGLTLAKLQGVILALPLVVLTCIVVWPYLRKAAGVVALVVVLGTYIASAWVIWSDQPEWMQNINRYHSVLVGVAVHAPYSTQALSDLGMDPGLARYTGKGWWDPEAGRNDPAFWAGYDRTSLSNVAKYYVTHPETGLRAIGSGVSASFEMRPDYLGNYAANTSHEAREHACRWCGFSTVTNWLRPISGVVVVAFHVLALVGLVLAGRARRAGRGLVVWFQLSVVAAVAILWYDLAVIPAVLGDGTYELIKHTVFGSYALGVCAWSLIGQAVVYFVRRSPASNNTKSFPGRTRATGPGRQRRSRSRGF